MHFVKPQFPELQGEGASQLLMLEEALACKVLK